MEVDIDSIRWAIIRAPRLKISEASVRTDGKNTIRISIMKPKGESNIYAIAQALKRALPKIVIKVSSVH